MWQLFADPRRLERWWGPPSYPATVTRHDLTTGGRVEYYMTGPEGDTPGGYWNVLEVEAPTRIDLIDGFADPDGTPIEGMPVTEMSVRLASTPNGGTALQLTSIFASAEAMEQMLGMGMEEGLREAISQMDEVLDS